MFQPDNEVRLWNVRLQSWTPIAMPSVKRKKPEAEEQEAEDGCLALHCGKFVPWRPTAVLALAATGDGSVVALARESGDIEIWDTEIWHCIKASTLECLNWLLLPPREDVSTCLHTACLGCLACSRNHPCWCNRKLQARRMQP